MPLLAGRKTARLVYSNSLGALTVSSLSSSSSMIALQSRISHRGENHPVDVGTGSCSGSSSSKRRSSNGTGGSSANATTIMTANTATTTTTWCDGGGGSSSSSSSSSSYRSVERNYRECTSPNQHTHFPLSILIIVVGTANNKNIIIIHNDPKSNHRQQQRTCHSNS